LSNQASPANPATTKPAIPKNCAFGTRRLA
jgi:hypothetical protein